MKLRSIRDGGPGWNARFFERDARFWPVARAAREFADEPDWPAPETYGRAFIAEAPVRFEAQKPRVRVRHGRKLPIDRGALYDACIMQGVVPTRPRHWHDFMNALVWATFPRAKWALHARQHRLVEAWLPEGAFELPNARTPAQDALALVDEGGVVLLRSGDHDFAVPFGHALFEGIVFDVPSMVARAVVLETDAPVRSADEAIARVDRDLPRLVERLTSPADLGRYAFHGATAEAPPFHVLAVHAGRD